MRNICKCLIIMEEIEDRKENISFPSSVRSVPAPSLHSVSFSASEKKLQRAEEYTERAVDIVRGLA